ncbi:MAG: heat-inducible transcriptional repressor HrcA [Candidatus Nitrospinota bacterium M3_3B_026]
MLDSRAERVLDAAVELHMESKEPVGAGRLAEKRDFNLCPASIRNVMADLERKGYLTQPHTSAGRTPTDKGYRYYADRLAGPVALPKRDMNDIRRAARRLTAVELADFMGAISGALSRLSLQAGLVGLASWGAAPIRKIQLVHIKDDLIMAVVVFDGGGIKNVLMNSTEAFSPGELDRMSNYFNHRFSGLSIADIRRTLLGEMKKEKNRVDELVAHALVVAEAMEARASEGEGNSVRVEGASRLIDQLGARFDVPRIKALFDMFNEKGRLVSLVNDLLKAEGVNFIIGSESEIDELADFSFVTHTFSGAAGALGAVGIIGPKRMNYGRAVSLVTYAARQVSLRLAGRLDEEEEKL